MALVCGGGRRRGPGGGVRTALLLGLLLPACSEYAVHDGPQVDPADPPDDLVDAQGNPPEDWNTCSTSYYARYYNLPGEHSDLEPETGVAVDPDAADWWDTEYFSFQDRDPGLDFGGTWYPVDDGLEGDPDYFSAQWTAWLRVYEAGSIPLVVGVGGDRWVEIDGAEVIARVDEEYSPSAVNVQLTAGQFPVHIRYAQRSAAKSGLRFRVASEAAKICFPSFPED